MLVVPTLVVAKSVQSTPPLVVNTICPAFPTATPLLASLIDTPFMTIVSFSSCSSVAGSSVFVVAAVQVTPPLVVNTIVPDLPTATPLLASLIDIPSMIVVPTLVVVASVQSTPPLVVNTICPDAPTATPLLESLIDTPYI